MLPLADLRMDGRYHQIEGKKTSKHPFPEHPYLIGTQKQNMTSGVCFKFPPMWLGKKLMEHKLDSISFKGGPVKHQGSKEKFSIKQKKDVSKNKLIPKQLKHPQKM